MAAYVKGRQFKNTATSTGPFDLEPGQYACTVVATFGGGSVKLQRLSSDGTTYVSVDSGTDFTANGAANVNLCFGTYRFTVATATAVYADISPVVLTD